MTRFVLDASVALSWFFPDEYSPYADYIARIIPDGRALVPIVWPLEMANAFLTAVRRGRLSESEASALVGALNRLQIDIDHDVALKTVMQTTLAVGITHHLSAYDASYLELAIRRSLPLATQNQRIWQAATAAGIRILQP
jgi:predicted nucleic acid-binding protein